MLRIFNTMNTQPQKWRFPSPVFAVAFSFLFSMFCSLPVIAQDSDEPKDETPKINSGLVSSLKLRGIGPALMSGRISDIAIDPVKKSTWYITAASGGVWKTTNAGTTWKPIFDNYGSYSIGCVTIDPNNRFTIWVGTGENNSQRSVGYGDGLYKSIDGGKSFTKVGLDNSEHISKIIVHPKNSNIVYVAAQGPLWSAGGDRGLYKTTDGGKTWSKVLSISENTGVNDLIMDPRDPNTLYATSYQRRRHVWVLLDGGPESKIHKSTDGGKTWREINRGIPSVDKGRIGLAISPMNPDVLYAIVEAAEGQGGFFRSADRGESWQKQSSYLSGSPQYYQEIVPCPHKFDRIYSLDTYMMVSEDGGKSFGQVGEADKHVDNHALVIDPLDENHLLVGCDGGVYESWDRGRTYDFKANLPLTQFYKVAVSNDEPFYYVYGGTQDNATQGGPSRTANSHGIRNSDWFITVFGDGFDPAVDPNDPNTVYSQWQYGGLVRFDRKTGERIDIRPQGEKDGPTLRWNWDSALAISPHNSNRIYYGSQILFRSDDRGDSWTPMGGDLSRNLDRNKLKVMDRIWSVDAVAKNASTSFYGTIVTVDESPKVEGLIYAGTDDGLVQVTEDGGENWRAISKFGSLDVPEYGYINDIEASVHDADTVYVAVNNHKRGDFQPYIVMSSDRGKSWSSISGNLPKRGSVYTLKQDHVNPNLLFCGTEFGVFFTIDSGKKWIQLKSGMPTVAVRDIEIQRRENDLVLASFGRGFYILDDYSPLRTMSTELLEKSAHMFPIKKGLMYVETAPLALGGKAFQGANFYTAPNPDYGVTFTYFLKDSLRTKKSVRKSKEARNKRSGADNPYPTWEELKAEDRQESPVVFLTIRDSNGEVLRYLRGSTSAGMHRTTWNYGLPGYTPTSSRGDGRGPIALPGKYTVSISKMVDGEISELLAPQPFEIAPIGWDKVSQSAKVAQLEFNKKVGALQRAFSGASQVANSAAEQIQLIKRTVDLFPQVDKAMRKDVRATELKLKDIMEKFSGDPTKRSRQEPAKAGLSSKLRTIVGGSFSGTMGPTKTHMQLYEVVADDFSELLIELKAVVEKEIPALNQKLEDSKAPWTPGRKIPAWKK